MMPEDDFLLKGVHADHGRVDSVRVAGSTAGELDARVLFQGHAYHRQVHL